MRMAAKAALWCSMALIVPTTLALPCGSLIFWLSSSCLMIGWVRVQPVQACASALTLIITHWHDRENGYHGHVHTWI